MPVLGEGLCLRQAGTLRRAGKETEATLEASIWAGTQPPSKEAKFCASLLGLETAEAGVGSRSVRQLMLDLQIMSYWGSHSLRSSGVLGNEPGRMNEESESAKDQVIIISSNLGYSRGIHIQRQRRRANVTQASSEGIRSKPQKMDWNQQLSRTITLEKGRWDCADQ
ncbi:unnamed protein product [Caretta caretta]